MLFDKMSGYHVHLAVPLRAESRQTYVMQDLELRMKKSPDSIDLKNLSVERDANSMPTFRDEETRRDFLFKVFLLLSLQFVLILAVIFLTSSVVVIRKLLEKNPLIWQITGLIGLATYIILLSVPLARRLRPLNAYLISVFVLSIAIVLSAIQIVYEIRSIFYTSAVQASIVIFTTVLTKLAPCDAAGCAMVFCAIMTSMAVFSVVGSFVWYISGYSIIHLIICGVVVVSLTVYLLYDIHLMMEGKYHSLRADEYVRGTIHLYLDLVCLWLHPGYLLLCRRLRKRTVRKSEREVKEEPQPGPSK